MKISILTAVRNEEKHLAEMLQSLQAQTYPDWEVLLVDDGSTDRTVEIIKSYAEADARIMLVAQESAQGKVHAFNVAESAATGDVVALLAGDDRLPTGALAVRVAEFEGTENPDGTLALFKLKTFSEDPKFDGMVLPKGEHGSRSGGSMTMSRDLADKVFPIPEHLVSEDIWLAEATDALAARVVSSKEIVLEYRIHDGNSNPRHQPFERMSEATHKRHAAWRAVLDAEHIPVKPERAARLELMWTAEQMRVKGQISRLLFRSGLPLLDRAAMISKSNKALYNLRSRYYKLFSGWRGR